MIHDGKNTGRSASTLGQHSRLRQSSALPEFPGGDAVTVQTECADVVEVALAPTFTYRQDMVSIPKSFARAGAKPPVLQQFLAAPSARVPESPRSRDRIDRTLRADTFVSQKDLLPQIAGLRSQLPLMHAEL